jgi:DNA-binding transcriptional regulator YdaS (Cro superfamily)
MGLEKAITAAGSQAELARLLNVTDMAVSQWKRRGVPPERCVQIEIALKGAVTRADLRPDLWPQAQAA